MNAPAHRLLPFEVLRTLAALAVVGVHVAAAVLVARPGANDAAWWAANLIDALCHFCVPVFVMISGALWLGSARPETARDVYRRRARRLIWPLLGWTLIYLVLAAFTDPYWSPARAALSVLQGTPWYHLWYLWMLPGLILCTPLLRRAVARYSRPQLWRLAALLCALAALEVPLGLLRQSFLTSFLLHLGPFLLGHLLFTAHPKIPARWLWAGAVLCGLGVALGAGLLRPWLGERAIELMYAYPNPLVLGMGVCVFLLGLRFNLTSSAENEKSRPCFDRLSTNGLLWAHQEGETLPRPFALSLSKGKPLRSMLTAVFRFNPDRKGAPERVALVLAPLSFGIYLIHPLWLLALQQLGASGVLWHPALGIPLVTLGVFALSALSVATLLHVPVLRRGLV